MLRHIVTRRTLAALAAAALLPLAGAASAQQKTLRMVAHSDLKIIDPIWTTAYIVRNHGYMIYDTLFATDDAGAIQLQMLGSHTVSADQLTHTMVLREGLEWHDGQPVTAEDCVASIKRWAAKDSMGQKMMSFVDTLSAKDAKTIEFKLKSPTGLVTAALGKPSSNVPFMMPKRVAETDPNKQLEDTTGSGPFIFKRDEWKPGNQVVYIKNPKYKPRPEPASNLAGGKVVKVDRVEWKAVADQQQAVNALLSGEIDLIEQMAFDLIPIVEKSKEAKIHPWNKIGNQYVFRPNSTQPPFDKPKIREALWYAFNQKDFLDAVVGDPKLYKECLSMFVCGSPLASEKGMDGRLTSNMEKARALLKEGGYNGEPIVLMHSTDLVSLTNLAPVAKSLMEKAGIKVEMQSMDWQTLVARRAKKDPASAGGWHAFLTAWSAADVLNPVGTAYLNSACEKALFGWPCDPTMEKLRDDYARATDPAKQKELAEAVQVRALEMTPHIHLGQYFQPGAIRHNVKGWLIGSVPVYWNIEVQ